MPTRQRSDPNSQFKFGFNGKKKENEINVNGGDFPMAIGIRARIYASRLGRCLSLDPLQHVYTNLTSYNAIGNNPILIIDPSGKILQIQNGTTILTYKDGKLFNTDGTNYTGNNEFINQVFENIKLLNNTEAGLKLVNDIANNQMQTVTIKPFDQRYYSNVYDVKTNALHVDNELVKLTVQDGDKLPYNQETAPFIILGHELAHSQSDLNGLYNSKILVYLTTGQRVVKDEIYACNIENKLRAENCMLLRSDYSKEPTITPPGASIPISGVNTNTTSTKLIDINGGSIFYKKVI